MDSIGNVFTKNACVLKKLELDLPLNIVVINVLSVNVYLFKFNIVLAINKILGLILSAAQNSLINWGLIFLDTDFNFEDFKQYQNFEVVYSPELEEDTIIIENLKERFDASILSQSEKIIREILEKTKKDLDVEEYLNET